MTTKKAKKTAAKAAKKPAAETANLNVFLARAPGGKSQVFSKKSEALAFAEAQSKSHCVSGCEVVGFDKHGKQTSTLTLNLKLEPSYVWSDE